MKEPTDAPPHGICVIGRSDFETGIGRVTLGALESFSRYYDVFFHPTRPGGVPEAIDLPSGARIPIAPVADGFAVYFYTDVLWNGIEDLNYRAVPDHGMRIAHIAYDSDELPEEWVRILNERFDLALFSAGHLENIARASGVRIPVATLPIALDIEELIARGYLPPRGDAIRLGTISAFHERKGLDVLVRAFQDRFSAADNVSLTIHSNLAIGAAHDRVARLAKDDRRITISHGALAEAQKNDLLDSFDIYVCVSSGEGYSIGPREALALGKPLVLSDIGAHRELMKAPGVFRVPASGHAPARYPEIDNRVFGRSEVFDAADVGRVLGTAVDAVRAGLSPSDAHRRKMIAGRYSRTSLSASYAKLIDPTFEKELRHQTSDVVSHSASDELAGLAIANSGTRGRRLGKKNLVVPMRDAGFFSIFNVFMSHLAHSLREDSVAMVLPDWDAGRLIERCTSPVVSFCYGKPDEGNLWLSLFEPLYGLEPELLNDREFLYRDSTEPADYFNVSAEPYLTYVNAYWLYRAPWFARFRQQYNSVLRDYVRLRPEYRTELDGLLAPRPDGLYTISVHVKHPSHGVEQPGGVLARTDRYLAEVRAALARRGINQGSDDWRVFVATDQDRVIAEFEREFGSRILRFDDVTRVNESQSAAYDALSAEDQMKEGHQLQHLLANDTSRWSSRLAWEVWRDAEMMANSDVLIHAVSNVSTAVSYLGTDVAMVYCDPDES